MPETLQRLIVLRHAEAAATGARAGDRERPLTDRGRTQARAMRAHWSARALAPAVVLCSPALRTRETWDRISDACPAAELRLEDELYLGSVEVYLAAARSAGAAQVAIVGHNPTCAGIVAELGGARKLGFDGRFAPGSLCVADWSDGHGRAVHLVAPTSLSAG